MKSPVLAAAPLAASVAWTVALIIDGGGFGPASVFLLGLGLLLMGVVAVVGMVVAGGRWARRLGFGVVAANTAVAVVRPIDLPWLVAMAITALASAALFAPSVTTRVRKLPAASGPPVRAVLAPLILLATPFVMGMTAPNASWAELAVGLTAPIVAFAYARVVPGGLLAIRYVWPALAVGLSFPIGLPAGMVSFALGVIVFSLAADESVKTAFHPPREVGSTYPIPPELAPKEVLDTAEIDDRGQPR